MKKLLSALIVSLIVLSFSLYLVYEKSAKTIQLRIVVAQTAQASQVETAKTCLIDDNCPATQLCRELNSQNVCVEGCTFELVGEKIKDSCQRFGNFELWCNPLTNKCEIASP